MTVLIFKAEELSNSSSGITAPPSNSSLAVDTMRGNTTLIATPILDITISDGTGMFISNMYLLQDDFAPNPLALIPYDVKIQERNIPTVLHY